MTIMINTNIKKEVVVLFYIVSILSYASIAFGKAGSAIPVSKYSAQEAANIVMKEFQSEYFESGLKYVGPGQNMMKDFFIQEVIYTKNYEKISFGRYQWVVRLLHPIHNDNSFVFTLKESGEVILLKQAE